MTTKNFFLLLTAACTLAVGTAYGQESDAPATPEGSTPSEQRPDRSKMTEEQRAAARERRQNMTDEERQAMRDQKRERWQNMSEEERQAKRDQKRARQGQKDGQQRRGGKRPSGDRPPQPETDAV